MYKVFLVEDEFALRERMKRNIPWEENELCLVGEAEDGELAYPMILKLQPDIIITDIKMPFMDGLALSKLVKQERPDIKIIILSGYDEFEYAKEAINIGITDYLLKPITPKQMIASLKNVMSNIEKERVQVSQLHKDSDYALKEARKQRNILFNELTTCTLNVQELFEKFKALDMDLIGSNYNLILAKVILEAKNLQEYEQLNKVLEESISKWCESEKDVLFFNREVEGLAFIVKGMTEEAALMEQKVISMLQTLFEQVEIQHYYIGIGQQVKRVSEIAKSFEAANKALAYRYLMQNEKVIYYKALGDYRIMPQEEQMSIKEVDVSQFDKKVVIDFFKNGVASGIPDFVHKYLEGCGGNVSILFREYMAMDIYLSAINFIEGLGAQSDALVGVCGDLKNIHKQIATPESASIYLEKVLNCVFVMRDQMAMNRYDTLIEEAKAYMMAHYNEEDISLNSVAEHVGISPSHFSSIFSQEVGQTFISYLTQIRMEKAKELLRCSNMKSFEIGFAIGYKDPHYFSYLFKKTQNCTPKEYRNHKEI
ncbi:response regulator transcription factor [Cellulosilyticum ruminicola]|uniref:response regulator transcription factor n=1 Tax=Cellulosilyticum ruminicola TaxID=425254 RepID=UPI0006D138F0|nr:response regulator [Cellulosilyticum ruminicola]